MRMLKMAVAILCIAFFLNGLPIEAQNAPGTPLPPASTTPPVATPSPAASTPAPGQQPTPPPNPNPNANPGGPGGVGTGPAAFRKAELEMGEKFETLAQLSPQQLDVELQKWPRYQQMDLGERGKLLQRMAEYRDHRHKAAEGRARELGLNLTPDQFPTFETHFWQKKLQADRQLYQEMEPRRKALDQQINAELKQEFAASIAPAPPTPPPTSPQPAQTPPQAPTLAAPAK